MSSIRFRVVPLLCSAACVLVSCGGGSGSSPPAPQPDFTIAVSPTSLTAVEGGTSTVATFSIEAVNGFTGGAAVSISGLPLGATVNPAFPLAINAGSSQQFTIVTTDATPTGTAMLTVHATSGSLAHDASLTLITGPVVKTSQQGTVLYLQSHANGHTARIGLDTAWGGAIVEVSLDGINFVNAHDTGREVQPALYDAAAPYGAQCTQYGWDPVLAGDFYDHGSQVSSQSAVAASLYTKTIPVQWCPDQFGGGPGMTAPSDMSFEQTVTLAPGAALAFQLHLKLTHTGTDTHYNQSQEFPAVYVNSAYTTFVYYEGTSPWTNGAVSQAAAPISPADVTAYTPEKWAALVDASNQGLTVFVPSVYPSWHALSFPQSGGSGPTGDATVYMTPMTIFTIAPGAVIEGDIYLVPGDASAARSVVYALHQQLTGPDIVAPVGTVDVPVANATLGGSGAQVAGWAFAATAVAAVTVYVDGTAKGTATLGTARPDVAAAYPNLAPPNSGWTYALDTTPLSNSTHVLEIRVTDTSGNEATLLPIPITVSN